jgi:hypothetical protein
MDDYYELLGVGSDASVDEIRAAYRERKAALDAAGDATAKTDAARLNRAWNVLSDPYQRGRYDQRLAQRGDGEGDEGDHDDDEEAGKHVGRNGARAARGGDRAAPRAARAPLPPPTITPPRGTRWPVPKQRVIAMTIDLGVLLVLVMVSSFAVVPAVARAQKPEVVDRIEVLNDQIDEATEAKDAAKRELDAAKDASPPDQAEIDAKQRVYDGAKQREEDLVEEVNDEGEKLFGLSIAVMGGAFLAGLAYLVVPSALTGRTLGKRAQRIKVVREDGEPLRLADALKRYGPLVAVSYVLLITPIGLIGAALVLIGVLRWMRNQNFQGLHDRFAHTIIVADAN